MLKKLIFCFALKSPLSAAAESYVCTTTNFGQHGWVGDRIGLTYDLKSGTAMAIDFGIQEIHGKPIPVEFRKRSDTSFILNWKIKGLKASNGGSGINSYKVTLFTSRNKFTLSGRRHGFGNVISASGTCKPVK